MIIFMKILPANSEGCWILKIIFDSINTTEYNGMVVWPAITFISLIPTVAYDILLASSRPSFFGRQGQVCGIASWSPQPNDKHLPRMFECGGLIISSFATLKLNVIKYDQPAFYVYKYTVCVRICLNRSMIYYISYIYILHQ